MSWAKFRLLLDMGLQQWELGIWVPVSHWLVPTPGWDEDVSEQSCGPSQNVSSQGRQRPSPKVLGPPP